MIKDSSKLNKGQLLRVNIDQVKDRIPAEIIKDLKVNPVGKLIGYKMVDGNQFGLALELENYKSVWFFENELSETEEDTKEL